MNLPTAVKHQPRILIVEDEALIAMDNDPRFIMISRDITERRQVEQRLQAALREKALLKEWHHRVKNNLQVITSLLRLEAERSHNGHTRTTLKDMQDHIRAMALLHEPNLAIIRDGAGQFAILLHALCWIHAERFIHKLIPFNDGSREAVAQARAQGISFWECLQDRVSLTNAIAPLPMLIRNAVASGASP